MSGKKKKVTGPCKRKNHIITDWNEASVILQKKKKNK